jgi:putative transposase
VIRKREGSYEAKYQTGSYLGKTPEPEFPLAVFQIDHTLVDVILVNALDRRPIGRPYLTVAIDVYSRCIAGFCLTLEPPSAVSVGLCLAHAVHDKNSWLIQRNLTNSWPIWGKPHAIVVDNATEFHSEALKRGCEYHGIRMEYRPPGQPHWGGVIERLIGTLMQLIHQLPGTSFSNIKERGNYDAEKYLALTLDELERWVTIAIVDYYHQKPHSSLLKPPIEQYHLGILGKDKNTGKGYPARLQNNKAFLIDFLPITRRQLRPQGLVLDHVTYFSNSITPLIAERHRYGSVIVRRDPRDLGKIYLLDPRSQTYLEIPYRHLGRPTITLWEHRQAR